MFHSFLLSALLFARLSLANESDTESEEENRPWVFNLATDVTSVIRQFLEPEQYYQLVFALRDPESPFTWQTVGYDQTTAAIRRNLVCPEGGSDVIFDSQDWFVLEHPVRPGFYPTQCPYNGKALVYQKHDYICHGSKSFCKTMALGSWHLQSMAVEDHLKDWLYTDEGDSIAHNVGEYEKAWLLDHHLLIVYRNRKVTFIRALSVIECQTALEESHSLVTTLDHDLNTENVGFQAFVTIIIGIVEVDRRGDTLVITNTEPGTGVSTQIEAKLPESFRMHNYHLHVKGQWLLVTGQIRFGWKLLVIDTEDGSVKQRVPLMGLPHSVEISPQAEYALISFQFDTLPIHLIHLDSPFPRLTIVPGSFGYESPEWLTHELFKMAITCQGIRYYCVRSAATLLKISAGLPRMMHLIMECTVKSIMQPDCCAMRVFGVILESSKIRKRANGCYCIGSVKQTNICIVGFELNSLTFLI